MKTTIRNLRSIISEAINDVFSDLEINRPTVIDGYTVEIRKVGDVFMGIVDGGNFGQGKTRRSAESGIRKRLKFLATTPSVDTVRSGSEWEADLANAELTRREKIRY